MTSPGSPQPFQSEPTMIQERLDPTKREPDWNLPDYLGYLCAE